MTLDFLCNGRYLNLNFDVTSCDFHHHVTSVKALITIMPREVITVRSLIKNYINVTIIQGKATLQTCSIINKYIYTRPPHTHDKGKNIHVSNIC
jgi:hypothetical protein